MTRPASSLYLWVFLAAVAAGYLATLAAGRFARRIGVVDTPGGRKAHLEPVSMLGGIGIYGGSFLAAWSLAPGAREELKGFFLGGFVILVFGIQDDITPMDPWVKTLAEVAAALVPVGFGVQVHLTGVAAIDVTLTVLWTWVVMNAFNYQDNMNGLCAGLAAASGLGIFALSVTTQQYLVAVLSLGLAGGCIGFLPHNYPRARIFMGDAGALFIGFVVAFLGIRLRFLDRPQSTTFYLPALVVAVPLFDFLLVTVSRVRRGISITQAGTDHTSHRLARLGLRQWAAVAVLWLCQLTFSAAALSVSRHPAAVGVVVLGLAVAAGLTGAALLERRPVTAALPRRAA